MPDDPELVMLLRRAAADGEMLWLHWRWVCLDDLENILRNLNSRPFPTGSIDCVPLWVGDQLLTVCEIDASLRFNRILVLRLAALAESQLPFHPRGGFLKWALRKHDQTPPAQFPATDSLEKVLADALSLQQPVTLVDTKGERLVTGLLDVSDREVTFQAIDTSGSFCCPEQIQLDELIMVGIGGVAETLRLEHAQQSPHSYGAGQDTI